MSTENKYKKLIKNIRKNILKGKLMIDSKFSCQRIEDAGSCALNGNYELAIQHLKQVRFK